MTNKEKHKKLWMWLAENAEETFSDLPRAAKVKAFKALHFSYVHNHCFACEEVGRDENNQTDCTKCPCTWGAKPCTPNTRSIYCRWGGATTTALRKVYALKIADCWKEGKKK